MQTYLQSEIADEKNHDPPKKLQKQVEENPILLQIREEEQPTLLQIQGEEQPMTILQKQAAEQYISFKKLSEKLQREVINNLQLEKWREIKILHIESFFNILSEVLLRDIKVELCLPLLSNVEEFRKWGESTLKELSFRMKPTFYVDRTVIVRERDPISEILFVLHGELWTYTSRATESDYDNNDKDHLEDGDFFGKELVNWVQGLQAEYSYKSRLPISTRTIQARKNVEAFVLMACDLKEIFIKHKQEQQQAKPEINPVGH